MKFINGLALATILLGATLLGQASREPFTLALTGDSIITQRL